MSTLTVDAIARAGLAEIAFARSSGDLDRVRANAAKLKNIPNTLMMPRPRWPSGRPVRTAVPSSRRAA